MIKSISRFLQGMLPVVLLMGSVGLEAQITGGQQTFQFLSLSPAARITGLGSMQIAVRDDDPVFAAGNPAALNPSMDGHLSFNHNFFLTDIQHGYVAYAQHLPKIGFTVHGGLQYVSYGELLQTDEYGAIQGKLKASETAFTLGGGRQLSERFSMGLNLRFAVSTLDVYQASALMADAGLMYVDTARRFSAALVLRNYGAQLATYNGNREALPNDIQLGVTKRLKYLPFRFGVMAHHLYTWDIRYDDPNLAQQQANVFGDNVASSKGSPLVDNFFRHLVFNGEFLFGSNESFRLRFGYNHLLKRELSVGTYRSLAGFSAGVGVKIKRFRIDAAYGSYHLAGGVFHIGIGTNLKEFF